MGSPKVYNKRLPGIYVVNSDGTVRIWHKKHQGKMETIPSGGGDVKMWEIFSRHTLDSLVPVKQLFKGRSEGKTAFHNITSSKELN